MTYVILYDDIILFFLPQSSLKMWYIDRGVSLSKNDTRILTCISNYVSYHSAKMPFAFSGL